MKKIFIFKIIFVLILNPLLFANNKPLQKNEIILLKVQKENLVKEENQINQELEEIIEIQNRTTYNTTPFVSLGLFALGMGQLGMGTWLVTSGDYNKNQADDPGPCGYVIGQGMTVFGSFFLIASSVPLIASITLLGISAKENREAKEQYEKGLSPLEPILVYKGNNLAIKKRRLKREKEKIRKERMEIEKQIKILQETKTTHKIK